MGDRRAGEDQRETLHLSPSLWVLFLFLKESKREQISVAASWTETASADEESQGIDHKPLAFPEVHRDLGYLGSGNLGLRQPDLK